VTSLRPTGRRRQTLKPFTVAHFRVYCSRLVFDDGQRREPEPWQLDYAAELFRAMRAGEQGAEEWLIVPEGNGKTTFVAELALYGCDWAPRPWIPVGASSREQAKILYVQAKAFVEDTPGLDRRFRCFDGYRAIRPYRDGKPRTGPGIEIKPWDPDSNDGAIPFPYFICDELHRHPDMSLWRLWKGKCRKRGAVGVGISTAGEPGMEFEAARDNFRQNAKTVEAKHGGHLYRGRKFAMLEFRLKDPEKALDPKAVAKVNPLSLVTSDTLKDDLDSPSFDIGDWKRLKCNIAARSSLAAISDEEWGKASCHYGEIPEGERCDAGLDLGWKHDTTALVAQWLAPEGYHLWDEARVLVPPRDGSTQSPDRIKQVLYDRCARNPIDTLVMDMSDGVDIANWAVDELGLTVVERGQGNDLMVQDYKNVMRGLRSGQLRRVNHCPLLTRHTMNAIGRRLPRGDTRFDRPSVNRMSARLQDVRVIDGLTAAGFVYTNACEPEPETLDLAAYRITTI
jgi:phage terminase large subunit-like protein